MSVSADGQNFHCDGAGCDSRARVPVALRARITHTGQSPGAPTVHGWLFATNREGCFHYCPRCIGPYLIVLAVTGGSKQEEKA